MAKFEIEVDEELMPLLKAVTDKALVTPQIYLTNICTNWLMEQYRGLVIKKIQDAPLIQLKTTRTYLDNLTKIQ
ncbi:MAG: hypothetical protein WC451_05030 [Patescibacteria group bacterium]